MNVTGVATGGGFSGSTDCSIPDISLPPNSSAVLNFKLPTSTMPIVSGLIEIAGISNNPNISVAPLFPNIKISGGRWNGNSQIVVKTGPNFSGGSYTVTSDIFETECATIGNITLPVINNSLGKVKLTEVEALNPLIFPESGCIQANMYGTGSGGGCRYGFSGVNGLKVIDYAGSSPILFGGDLMRSTYSRITPTSFTLIDPMNPVFSNSGVVTVSSDSVRGEHGMTTPVLSAISKDGKYSAVKTNYGVLAIRTPTKGKTVLNGDFLDSSSFMDIVKYNSNYLLLYDRGVMNITNPDDIEAPIPDGFPNFNDYEFFGKKMILGDGSYIAVSAHDDTGHIQPPNNDILLFSINEPEPIAKLSMPAGHEKINFHGDAKISFPGGIYIFTLGSSGVNLFKLEYINKKITWVIKDASYSEYTSKYGRFFDATLSGFDMGNGNIGLISFNTKGIQAFLFSDIASGKWIDILVNSPKPVVNELGNVLVENGGAGSFSKDGITYVYTSRNSGAGQNINVWKFEPYTFSNTGGSNTGGNTGGTPVYPTPPTTNEDANCPGGTVYETSAGKLCVTTSGGVTTTTEYNFGGTPIQGCSAGDTYDSLTGKKCNKNIEFMGPPIYNFGTTTLRSGSTGEAVRELQRFLNNKLNLGLVIDGKLGPKTIAVIKKWQSDNGLVSDGLVGAKTKALMNAVAE